MGLPPLTQFERRKLGRFDTPRPLAQAITDWAVRNASDRVLEPSVGGGVFVQSATARLLELGALHIETQIVACDVDQRALDETAKNATRRPARMVKGNFLESGVGELGEDTFDVVLGNPPYVRLHAMTSESREKARKSLPEAGLLDAKASLWAYFPIHAFKFVKTGGRMAWILPETLLHSNYGKQLLQWAGTNFNRCIIVSLRERCFLADGAKERVVLLLLDGAGKDATREIEMIEHSNAVECISGLADIASQTADAFPKLNGHAVPHLLNCAAVDAAQAFESCPDLKRLGAFADIKIGVVTGDNSFFVMSELRRKELKLRSNHFLTIVSKYADLGNGFQVTTSHATDDLSRNLLLYPNPESKDRQLAKYLAAYTRDRIDTNRTMQKRSHWQCPLLGQTPDAFLRYMGKDGPRIMLNTAKSYCTNTIHGVYFKKEVIKSRRQALCLALHSTYSQLSAEFEGRQYGSGVLKLEPSEARRLCVAASASALTELSRAWRDLARRANKQGWQGAVEEIDRIILEQSPALLAALPLQQAKAVLGSIRQRRMGRIISEEDKALR